MVPISLKTRMATPKLRETRDFYIRLFGMRIAEEWDEPDDVGCILALAGGGEPQAYLEIYQGAAAHDFAGLSLQFRTQDLAGFARALPPEVPVRGPVERPWGSTYLYLTDPNGIAIMVYEGGL